MRVGGAPNPHRLSVRQSLLYMSPIALAQPSRAVVDVSSGRPVEPLTPDPRVHPEALSKKLVEVQLAQRLWSWLPFPGEIPAVWSRRLWLLDDEPLQGGEDLQRRLRHVLLPFGDNPARLFLWRRPVLLLLFQPVQCLGQELIAIAAQRRDVDPAAHDVEIPVAAVAGGID